VGDIEISLFSIPLRKPDPGLLSPFIEETLVSWTLVLTGDGKPNPNPDPDSDSNPDAGEEEPEPG
jgi:hypothetical protein